MERKVYDKNGFEIRKGDTALIWNNDGTTYIALVEKVGQKGIVVNERGNDTNKVKPSDVEVMYDIINVRLKNLTWDTAESSDGAAKELPSKLEIPLFELVMYYDLVRFDDDLDVCEAVNEYLFGTYNVYPLNYTYEYDRKLKKRVKPSMEQIQEFVLKAIAEVKHTTNPAQYASMNYNVYEVAMRAVEMALTKK